MAKQISVIQFAGKMGNTIGRRSRKGNPILGLDQGKYHNPNTQKQIEARTKFLGLCNAAGMFANCMVGLTPYAKANGWSLRNAFMKLNKSKIDIVGSDTNTPRADLLYEGPVVLSKGSLEVVGGIVSRTAVEAGGIDFTTSHDSNHPNRVKHIVCLDLARNVGVMKIVPYDTEKVHFDLPNDNVAAVYYYEAEAPDANTAVTYSGLNHGTMAAAEIKALANQMVYSETVYHA